MIYRQKVAQTTGISPGPYNKTPTPYSQPAPVASKHLRMALSIFPSHSDIFRTHFKVPSHLQMEEDGEKINS